MSRNVKKQYYDIRTLIFRLRWWTLIFEFGKCIEMLNCPLTDLSKGTLWLQDMNRMSCNQGPSQRWLKVLEGG